MCLRWETLRDVFDQFLLRPEPSDALSRATRGYAALASFPDERALRRYLVDGEGTLDERDAVLAALVTMVQARQAAEPASALLWIALWPGLDAIYRHRVRQAASMDDLVSSIAAAFTVQVHTLRVGRVGRVAATLVRSTGRAVVDELRRRWVDDRRRRALPDDDSAEMPAFPALEVEAETRALRSRLTPAIHEEVDLVLSVVVLGDTQLEAAHRLGISAPAARKRYQRAIARLRRDFTADHRAPCGLS